MKNERTTRRRGRPRAFDRDAVLATAAHTFWRLGYEGASVADLTAAMGITPQSLYAAFGSKARLYHEALAWYRRELGAFTAQALEGGGDAIAGLERVLRESAVQFTQPDRPRGCMISTAILTCAVENRAVADHVAALRGATLGLIEERIARGIAEGQVRADTDAGALARFVGAVIQGMSVQAGDGASTAELLAMAGLAIEEVRRHGTAA